MVTLGFQREVEGWAQASRDAICGDEPGEVDAALGWIACIEALPASEEVAHHARRVLAGRMRARAPQARSDTAALLQEAASCLDGAGSQARASEPRRLQVEVVGAIDGLSVPELCGALSHLPIACGAGQRFSVAARTLGVDHRVSRQTIEGTYDAGARRIRNPEWELRSQRVLALESNVRRAEGELRLAEASCRQAERNLFDARSVAIVPRGGRRKDAAMRGMSWRGWSAIGSASSQARGSIWWVCPR